MSSFKKDKKQVNNNITINSIENNAESELNITSNPNPESVKVSTISSEAKTNEQKPVDNVVVLDISKNEDKTENASNLKSEDLLSIVLNANINNIESVDKNVQNNTATDSNKSDEKQLLTYKKK